MATDRRFRARRDDEAMPQHRRGGATPPGSGGTSQVPCHRDGSRTSYDRVKRRHLYAAFGVGYFWLVDPAAQTVEAMRLDAGRWVDAGSLDQSDRAPIPPFSEVELEVGRLFPPQ